MVGNFEIYELWSHEQDEANRLWIYTCMGGMEIKFGKKYGFINMAKYLKRTFSGK